jgi:hypothetical protein
MDESLPLSRSRPRRLQSGICNAIHSATKSSVFQEQRDLMPENQIQPQRHRATEQEKRMKKMLNELIIVISVALWLCG